MTPWIKKTMIAAAFVLSGVGGTILFHHINGLSTTTETVKAAVGPEAQLQSGAIDSKNGKKIKYWAAPMDPTYIRNEPGKSPMGMDLVPVYEEVGGEKEPTSTIRIDPVTLQNMGVRTERIARRPLVKTIRAYGTVSYDERRAHAVTTKFSGWIEKLHVDFIGDRVVKGQPLFDIYSPELVTTQEEYLIALAQQQALSQSPYEAIRDNADRLLEASKTRLKYWDINDSQIQGLEKSGRPEKSVTVYSPVNGVVMKKMATAGSFVRAGQNQFDLVDLSRVWVDVEIYEYEMPWVRKGLPATMELSYIPGKTFKGKILYIYPYLSKKTRTARLRLEFANPNQSLKPDMYANIEIQSRIPGDFLVLPQQAVIDSGVRKIVFIAKGKGRFEPREVKLGVEVNNGEFQVLEGLTDGEDVVVSAQFMLDSESRLREAIQKMLAVRSQPDNAGESEAEGLDMAGMTMDMAADSLDTSGLTMEEAP
ncbi:MAG: efflux RND transporter periplasmic adaptor subunit [Desulfobacterales bacterium]|nr:efflux RND transporter periplasmic adaptor subunit [Desulfobacterales bacterium]